MCALIEMARYIVSQGSRGAGDVGRAGIPHHVVSVFEESSVKPLLRNIMAAMPDAQVGSAVRPEGVSMFDSMSGAVMPMWLELLNPVIGVFAVLYGAKLERGRGGRS